ncbi:hypothetical protein ACONXG_004292 [Yersinia enterocolitica]|uniref:hypothetical protein n=1 Tax=Yersinia enterocolitica TaxID=630 RepID=UPI001CA56206|nr:hypothetical protein [Yersinia enterocolitica]EKN4770491.1 hypothetical protein [Yersinia enterocolitica]EKN5956848.1 hypothetical protein [Yersinia enterocolitica]MBW5870428.1 hypothetical protein [Yersinia enterocolitica]
MENQIVISNLQNIEDIFKRLQSGETITVDQLKIELFSTVNIKIYGDPTRYNGTLPASLAQGLCEFQTEMYKVYTLIKYKTDNLQKLTTKDREEAEIIFTIDEGCTEIIAAFTELIKSFGTAFDKVTHGMSPNQKTLCFLFAITVIGGAWVGTSYLEHSSAVESKQEETKQEAIKIQSENEKLNILKDGMLEAIRTTAGVDAIDRAEGIQDHAAKAYAGVLKGADDADKIVISGATTFDLSQKQIHELIKNPTEKAKNVEHSLEVVIDSIKRSSSDKLTLSCREPTGDNSFPVSVDTSFIDDKDEISLLFDAMKENKTVKILGSYKVRAGIIEQGNASAISKP